MAGFDAKQLETIKETARKVTEHALYQAERVDSTDNPAFCAAEIIDLVEYMTDDIDLQSAVAKAVLEGHAWPSGTAKPVKDYFNLAY